MGDKKREERFYVDLWELVRVLRKHRVRKEFPKGMTGEELAIETGVPKRRVVYIFKKIREAQHTDNLWVLRKIFPSLKYRYKISDFVSRKLTADNMVAIARDAKKLEEFPDVFEYLSIQIQEGTKKPSTTSPKKPKPHKQKSLDKYLDENPPKKKKKDLPEKKKEPKRPIDFDKEVSDIVNRYVREKLSEQLWVTVDLNVNFSLQEDLKDALRLMVNKL